MPRRDPSPMRALAALLPAGLILWVPFLPAEDGDRHRFLIDWRPEPEQLFVLAGLAALALSGRRLPRPLRWGAAALIVTAAVLQFSAAVVLSFFDRTLDLYFDLPHVPKLLALFAEAAGPWRAAAVAAATIAGLLALVASVTWALAAIERALAPPRHAAACLAVAAVAIVLGAVPVRDGRSLLGKRTAAVVARQVASAYRAVAVMNGYDHTYAPALAVPQPPPGRLPGLKDRDVYLVFFESYGTIVLDDPRYASVVAPALAGFADTVEKGGYHLVSNRVVSPTFGGGSWLAHGTVSSGLRLDRFLSRLVVESRRETLPKYMRAAGYRTVNVMPGIKKPWPEAAFWGFDASYYAIDLGYGGPTFGWFDIPDQYTLRIFGERERRPGHPPLFAQLVLVSSHTPFVPVPPYVEDWRDAGDYHGIAQAEWDRIYRQPDWSHLEQPYLDSVVYDLRTLAAWLARLDDRALVVILGDHQPPGFISGEKQPWTVPIHVLSRDADLVRPFAARGYVAGALPPREGNFKGMETFLDDFLADFGRAPTVTAGHGGIAERGEN